MNREFDFFEDDALRKVKDAASYVENKFKGLKSESTMQTQPNQMTEQPVQMPAQPQMYEPAFVGPQNVVTDNGGQSNQNTNARVRVLGPTSLGPTSGYVPVPERNEEQPYMPNGNPFAALRSDDETSSYINNNAAFSYVLSGVLIVVLIVLLVVVTLGILKTFTI